MSDETTGPPDWALDALACPRCESELAYADEAFRCAACRIVGTWHEGIVRSPPIGPADSDGPRLHERARIPFTMSSLDTPVYHAILRRQQPADRDALILEIGAGDGRIGHAWLEWGFRRVVAVDAVPASLARFRERLACDHPEWLGRVLLVQADARRLPLARGVADRVLAIEVLTYLNDDFEAGLAEAKRVLRPGGRLVLSERDWEGALVTRLLYGGVGAFLEMRHGREVRDGGDADHLDRSRTFTEPELLALVEAAGLQAVERRGLSLLPLLIGYLRQEGRIPTEEAARFEQVCEFLDELGRTGSLRRMHVVVAELAAPARRPADPIPREGSGRGPRPGSA
jgi:SAM-dependent methyltransferase